MTFALAARSPNSLEPAYVVQGADNWAIKQIFDTLVRPDPGTFAVTPDDFRPSLAESWEVRPMPRPGPTTCAGRAVPQEATAR